jgi:hypothetical protein
MAGDNYRVLLESGQWHKVCRVIYGTDGSYYVTSPYREGGGAIVSKMTVNYARDEHFLAFEEFIELASVEDEQRAVKLSHHPDGLVQFSGPGVTSGRDENGDPIGVAVRSWPLDRPVSGPSFSMAIRGVESFETQQEPSAGDITFAEHELTLMPAPRIIYALKGHFFPPLWRRFVWVDADGSHKISIRHPCGAVLRLKVLLPPERCQRQGFLGLEVYSEPESVDFPDPSHGFLLSSSTGNLRRNERGELLGDQITCIAPRGDIPPRRSLDYRRPLIPPLVPVVPDTRAPDLACAAAGVGEGPPGCR